jgi:hypothetical protein
MLLANQMKGNRFPGIYAGKPQGQIRLIQDNVGAEMHRVIEQYRERKSWVFDLVVIQLAEIPFMGRDGLKHRSGLLEYRNDAV